MVPALTSSLMTVVGIGMPNKPFLLQDAFDQTVLSQQEKPN